MLSKLIQTSLTIRELPYFIGIFPWPVVMVGKGRTLGRQEGSCSTYPGILEMGQKSRWARKKVFKNISPPHSLSFGFFALSWKKPATWRSYSRSSATSQRTGRCNLTFYTACPRLLPAVFENKIVNTCLTRIQFLSMLRDYTSSVCVCYPVQNPMLVNPS